MPKKLKKGYIYYTTYIFVKKKFLRCMTLKKIFLDGFDLFVNIYEITNTFSSP